MLIKRWYFFLLGHIPRNMRVSLNMIDLAGPYIVVKPSQSEKDNKS